MIVLNGKKYANSKSELDETCSGYLRINKKSVSVLNKNNQQIANFSTYTVMGYYCKDNDGFSHPDNPLFGGYDSHDSLYEDIERLMNLIPYMNKYLTPLSEWRG